MERLNFCNIFKIEHIYVIYLRSKVELLLTRTYGEKLLTNIKKYSNSDPSRVLDKTLIIIIIIIIIIIMVYKLNGLYEVTVLKQSQTRLRN